MDLKGLTTKQLQDFAVTILRELKGRQGEGNVEFIQSKDCMLLHKDIPVDRPGWFYLPLLRAFSREFQPDELGPGRKIYRVYFGAGEILTLKMPGDVRRFRVDTAVSTRKFKHGLKGPLTVL